MAIGKIEILDMRGAKVGIGIKSINTYYNISDNGVTPPEFKDVDLNVNTEGFLGFTDIDSTFQIKSGIVYGSQNGIDVVLTIDQNLLTGIGGWQTQIPEVPEGWYLWTKTVQILTNGDSTVSYAVFKQGEQGQPGPAGLDASAFYIETNQTEILMFREDTGEYNIETGKKNYQTVFSPESLTGSIWEKDLTVEDGKKRVQLSENDLINFSLYLYNSGTKEFVSVSNELLTFENNNFIIDIKTLLTDYQQESVLKIQFNKTINDKNVDITAYLTVRFGIGADMANLSVNANGIVAAIQNTKLEFSASGLTVKNGGIAIENNEGNAVFSADEYGNLTLKGRINAWDSTFKGTLESADGIFHGTLSAGKISSVTGEIGGFTIDNNSLTSVKRTNNEPNIVLDGKYGKIIANNIELGTGATIKDYIKLGDSILLRNLRSGTSGNFLEVKSGLGTELLTFGSDGKIKVGSDKNLIIIDGEEGTITSTNYLNDGFAGWSLSNEEAVFNNVTVRGEIKSAVFTHGEVQAVGGNILVRPSGFIKDIISTQESSSDTAILIHFDGEMAFKAGDWGRISGFNGAEYWFQVDTTYQSGVILTKTYNPTLHIDLIGAPVINFGSNKESGISINGSGISSFTPQEAISLFEFNASSKEVVPKIILGKIPDKVDYGSLRNSYGLYAENALLKGSLITQGISGISCGLSTDFGRTEYIKAIRVLSYRGQEAWPEYITKVAINSTQGFQVGSECYIQINSDQIISAKIVQIWEDAILDLAFNADEYNNIEWIGLPISYVKRANPTTKKYEKYLNGITGSILLWAGADGQSVSGIENANFIVDQYGNVIARSGYFEGTIISNSTIEASEIKTATLTGSGTMPALIIRDCNQGIDFRNGENSVFYLGSKELNVNTEVISFNDNFKIDEIGTLTAPSIYIREKDLEKTLRFSEGKISVLDYKINEPLTSVVNFELDFSDGFNFITGTKSSFKITNQSTQVSNNFQVDGEISYGQVGKYIAVKDNEGKVIGYDLYINDGGKGE